jgi:hypothetical protein
VDKSLIEKAVAIMTNDESAEAADPDDRAFDLPAVAVASQFSTVLGVRSCASSSRRTNQIAAFGRQARAKFVAGIRSIGNHRNSRFSGRHLIDQVFNERDLSRRSTFGPVCKWKSLAICHHQLLCTLSTLRVADFFAPFLAGEKPASTNTSSQSKSPHSSSASRNPCQISTSTPSSSHSTNRRQQVLGEEYRSGKSHRRAPLRTHKVPTRQARSSAGGRPPRKDPFRSGMNSLIFFYCSSLTKIRVVELSKDFLSIAV